MEEIGLESIGHYKILSKLGAGGMGVVYLALDTRLGRKVALKLLPAEFIQDKERLDRFQQEARVISALNHPNILTIYEIGLGEGGYFIATEYIEGETLRQFLRQASPDLPRLLDIGIQVAEALSAAHEAGIIHRDVKPENIMLRRDGYVKILDFGIAKTAPQQRAVDSEMPTLIGSQTRPGVVLGTIKYMSPEQARGIEVDQRSDIFSLGVVLYEMASGRAPFEGGTSSDTLAAILLRDPLPLNVFSSNAHPDLQRILVKSLAKNRDERYKTAKDLVVELKSLKHRLELESELTRSRQKESGAASSVSTIIGIAGAETGAVAAGLPQKPDSLTSVGRRRKSRAAIDSIAVLPLENASADPNMDYLNDGITESIINNLSQLPMLRVMARSTVFRYKGQSVDPLAVGSRLDVRAVLTGRVFRLSDNLVIKTELVDVADGSQLWGEQYKRKFADIFEVEEEISREISDKLRLKLTGEERGRLKKRATESTLAYELYLKGRFYWNRRTGEGLQKGIHYFQQAIAVDPKYALAHLGLADSYALLAWFAFALIPPADAMPKAKTSAIRALEIDPTLAEAHVPLAMVKLLYEWDWVGAESEYKRAIDLKPHYATAHHWYPILLTPAGRFGEALREIGRALELEPLSLMINATRGWIFYYARRYDEAVDQFRKTLDMDPNFCSAHWLLGYTYEAQGKHEAAIAEFEEARRLDKTPAILSGLGHALAIAGQRDRALQILNELDQLSRQRHVSSESQALVYVGLGEHERAFEWLNKAMADRSSYLIYLNVDPRLDRLRADPRFGDLLRRVGLTQ